MQIEGLPVTNPDNLKLSPAEIAKLERGSNGTAGTIGSFIGVLFHGQGHPLAEAEETLSRVIEAQAPKSPNHARDTAVEAAGASYRAQDYIFGQNDEEND